MAVVVCQASSDLVCLAGSADTCWRLIVVPKLPGGDGQVVSVADPPWVFVDIVVLASNPQILTDRTNRPSGVK